MDWYAVQVHRQEAILAQVNLKRQGFDCFVPQFLKTYRFKNQFRKRRELLFPGYMFVTFDLKEQNWRVIRHTRGVSRLIVNTSGYPAPVPTGFVEHVMDNCNEDGLFEETKPLEAGTKIIVREGPFSGVLGEVVRQDDADARVMILLDLMGVGVRTTMPRGSLMKTA